MKSILTLLFAFSFHVANAGIHIEPYIGYQLGSYSGDAVAKTSSVDASIEIDGSQSGLAYGGKLGWGVLGLSAGLDYMKATIESDGDETSTDYDVSALGAYASFTFPILLSVSGTYFFDYEMVGDSSGTGAVNTTDSGNGFKVGIGFTFLPLVSINLDYIVANIDDVKLDNNKGEDVEKIKNADAQVKNIMIGLSLPFDL
jgi:hypothetical protein